jgi:hypothetical protein
MLYDWSMDSNHSTDILGSRIVVACARVGGANATPLFFSKFSAAYFAKRNLNGGGFQSEGAAEGGCGGNSAAPERSAGAKRRRSIGVFRKMGSDFFKQTPPKLISCLARRFAPRFGRHFREEMPRVSEIHRQDSRREAAVPKQGLDCAFSARADERFLEILGVSAVQFNHAIL